MRIQTDYICVVDLEATCWSDKQDLALPKRVPEIIEIGAVMLALPELEVPKVSVVYPEFQAFVKPVQNPALSDFCTSLTSIKQEEVDSAMEFPAVHKLFVKWLAVFGHFSVLMASQGLYDYRQLMKDCAYHVLPFPFRGDHLNLKEYVSLKNGWGRRGIGQKKALARLGIPIEGTQHRGIDDARMAAKMLQKVGYSGDEGLWYRPTAESVMRMSEGS